MQPVEDNNIIDFGEGEDNLTDWPNEPSVRELKQNYTDASSDHETHIAHVEKWLENMKAPPQYRGEGRSQITPKLIRKQAEWRYASLSEPFLSTPDIFNVYPVSAEDKDGAIQNELVLNNQFNTRIDKTKFVDELVRTCVDEGTAIVKLGWDSEEEEVEKEEPVIEFVPNPQTAPIHQQLHQLMQQNPEQYAAEVPPEMQQAHRMTMQTGQPIEPKIVGTKLVTETVLTKNQPTVEVCDYRNVTPDPTCMGDFDNAGFIIFSFETSLSELQKDARYSNLDAINIESTDILGDPDHNPSSNSSFNFTDRARKKFVAYEYWGFWDIENTGEVKPFICTWVGDVKIRMEESPFPDKKLPFINIQYLPKRKSNYGEPDGELLDDNQAIIGAVTRGMIDIMARSANGQTGVAKSALDVTNRRRFNRGEDYEFNSNTDPRQTIFMHTFPEIPQSAQFMLQFQNMDAESLTGIKAFSNEGISGSGLGDTATSARGALDAASKREMGILRRIADGVIKIGKKIVSMNQEFLSEEEVVRITDEEFVTIQKDDLYGEYDLRLSISTAEEDAAKAQELAFMLQTVGNTMPPEFSQIVLADIARLRKMPDLAEKIEDFQPKPDPVQQQLQQLEMQKLQAEIAKLQSEAVENQADAQLSHVKAGTEQIKGENIASDTDKKNLDFVEQETGTAHQREVDKIKSQAESQTRTKVVEAMLNQKPEKEKE